MPPGRDPSKDKIQEDDPRWNTQTMGNRAHKPGSPAAKSLVESGKLRMHAAPGTQARPRTKKKMDFSAAISRRLKNNLPPPKKVKAANRQRDFTKTWLEGEKKKHANTGGSW
jgi:hypothetical protein